MLKFKTAKLRSGKVEVTGPSNLAPGAKVRHLRFVIAQGDVMVEDKARVSTGGNWMGNAPAGGLRRGIAYGCGMAVILESTTPPTIQTFTWAEVIKVT